MDLTESQHEQFMAAALEQAKRALAVDEVPIGAVIADADGRILARAHNHRHIDRDPTAHAEMLVIRQAAHVLGDRRLTGCTLAVTLEPCCMCAGAIVLARIDTLVYAASDPKAGAVDTLYTLCTDPRLNHRVHVVSGILADQAGPLLTDFFRAKRAEGKK